MICKYCLERLIRVTTLPVFNNLTNVKVLHRMLVRGKRKLATNRLEVSLASRCAQLIKLIHIATDTLESAAN